MIVEGKGKIDIGLKDIEFGTYAMVYVGTINTTKIRSVTEIVLKTSNKTGGFYLMYLYTGKRIHIYIWYELPIDHKVTIRVEELDTAEYQKIIENRHPIFEWSTGHEEIYKEIIIPDNNQVL